MPETPEGAGVLSKRVDLLAPIEECCRVPRAGLRWRSRPPAMVPASTSFNTAPCPVSAIKWPRPQPTWAGPTPLVTPNGVTRRQKGSADGRLTVGVCRQ